MQITKHRLQKADGGFENNNFKFQNHATKEAT